jgi:U3 small nucleolar RNA-associated protein 4
MTNCTQGYRVRIDKILKLFYPLTAQAGAKLYREFIKTSTNFFPTSSRKRIGSISTMDIHRCRFVPYPPSTINALAFSHSHISSDERTAPPRLAIGRANGDIEIWNPLKGSWLQETIIRGGKDRSIDGLVWTQDPNEEDANGRTIIGKSRLFSIGYTTTVTEWDLEKGRPLRETSGNHGEIWCIAAQPALTPVANGTNGTSTSQWPGQSLVTGCTDGALVLYSTKDEDLQLQRVLARPSSKKGKAISIAFQDRNVVVAGYTDSTIRLVDIRNSVMLRSMTLGSGPKGGPKEILVWSVKVLADGTIVSGDSTGEVKIWDGKTYTLRQRIKSHRQDILSLATSFDGSAIFSGGMDRRTVVYKPVGKGKPRWAEVAHRRFHKHDVKTMASFEGNGMSVIVSGGNNYSLPLKVNTDISRS